MSSSGIFLTVLMGYAALMIIISAALRNQANKSISDYGLAQNRFGMIALTFITIGAWVGSGGLIGLSAWAYDGGMTTWWGYGITYFMMLPFAIFYVRRIRILKLYTVSEFFVLRYPKFNGVIRYPISILYIIRNATVLGMQLNAIAFLFTVFLDWQHWVSVCVAAIIAAAYSAISGFLSVMLTNLIQSVLQTMVPFVGVFFVVWYLGGIENVLNYFETNNIMDSISVFAGVDWYNDVIYYFIGAGIFFLLGDQSDWQRVASSKSGKSARNSFVLSVILVTPILLLPSYTGLFAKAIFNDDNIEANLVYYEIMKLAPPVVMVLMMLGVLATIFSCIGTYLFAGGMIISNDLIINIKEKKGAKLNDRQKINYNRVGIVLNCLTGIVFALWIPGVLDLFTRGLIIVAAGLLIPYLFAWHSKTMNSEGALAGMVVGGSFALIWSILSNPFGIDAVWIGIPLCFVTCVVVSKFTPPPGNEVYETYYRGDKFKNLD